MSDVSPVRGKVPVPLTGLHDPFARVLGRGRGLDRAELSRLRDTVGSERAQAYAEAGFDAASARPWASSWLANDPRSAARWRAVGLDPWEAEVLLRSYVGPVEPLPGSRLQEHHAVAAAGYEDGFLDSHPDRPNPERLAALVNRLRRMPDRHASEVRLLIDQHWTEPDVDGGG